MKLMISFVEEPHYERGRFPFIDGLGNKSSETEYNISYIRDFKFYHLVFNGSLVSGQESKLPGTDVEHSTPSRAEATNEC